MGFGTSAQFSKANERSDVGEHSGTFTPGSSKAAKIDPSNPQQVTFLDELLLFMNEVRLVEHPATIWILKPKENVMVTATLNDFQAHFENPVAIPN